MALYELRTYTAIPGQMPALLHRFRDHTLALLDAHHIAGVGFWIDAADPNTLVYLLRHDFDPEQGWAAFRADPRWIAARDASTADGPLTSSIESVFLTPTEFSQLS